MALKRIDHMKYLDGMDVIESDLMEKVLAAVEKYDYSQYSSRDVEIALHKDHLSIDDFGALLSPVALSYLEDMARKAKLETRKHFGNSISLFTPLYIANYCENECVYCGFKATNKIQRATLSKEDAENELKAIAATGLEEILLLTGESRYKSDVEYIGETIQLATKYFKTVGIEIYPLNVEEYTYLRNCGADFVSVYQETYNPDKYAEVHLWGSKRIFPYRFHAQERALLGGMRGVSFGALLGLDDFRKDAFAAGFHAALIQQKYPHAEIGFSVPRLRPFKNNADNNSKDVHEKQLLQVMLAYRLLMPYAGITISTRERAGFRDNVIGLVATKMSAGVSVGVGGHDEEQKGDEQFEISDERSVTEVHEMIVNKGLQPVYTDYIRV
ncbi:2-iminoacetate synthase ThiH [Schinkia azotoformans]|uniref:2-iminoacetate synthase ThiH n=1 Tax=Schinkia azotoformans TaxID=1454 RepID=UPI002DB5D80D|nr:2-iminoacetate synthase ThiH [Schinkia azotoformans]MEC1716120.1 2-iminoacetate synthase ThiH [Schinkia azotoformans]MEC1740591.1 2-iminoacetate synthase ThiH [Schinkia azotoformans]MEC1756159.1 2-iminoacetate synthase ThiH [Schinkia azotoformans]MEC1768804.1 2-iminoacetate synthase ThiH [Schinkia azotoformans]MEC1788360.1 2-iminoacetate synthase ThiH [Schinkia azotoformans]